MINSCSIDFCSSCLRNSSCEPHCWDLRNDTSFIYSSVVEIKRFLHRFKNCLFYFRQCSYAVIYHIIWFIYNICHIIYNMCWLEQLIWPHNPKNGRYDCTSKCLNATFNYTWIPPRLQSLSTVKNSGENSEAQPGRKHPSRSKQIIENYWEFGICSCLKLAQAIHWTVVCEKITTSFWGCAKKVGCHSVSQFHGTHLGQCICLFLRVGSTNKKKHREPN